MVPGGKVNTDLTLTINHNNNTISPDIPGGGVQGKEVQ